MACRATRGTRPGFPTFTLPRPAFKHVALTRKAVWSSSLRELISCFRYCISDSLTRNKTYKERENEVWLSETRDSVVYAYKGWLADSCFTHWGGGESPPLMTPNTTHDLNTSQMPLQKWGRENTLLGSLVLRTWGCRHGDYLEFPLLLAPCSRSCQGLDILFL